jgi:hypothetical protein
MSVLQKVGVQDLKSVEVKSVVAPAQLSEVKLVDGAETPVESQPRFIIVSSRIVSDSERNVLKSHGGIADYESRYAGLTLEECFKQLKCIFLIFQLTDHEDKLFVMTHMSELSNFNIVALKSPHESYDESWLTQLRENANAVIMKSLENNSLIKDNDFFKFLKTFVHINSPPSCVELVWRSASSFLGL